MRVNTVWSASRAHASHCHGPLRPNTLVAAIPTGGDMELHTWAVEVLKMGRLLYASATELQQMSQSDREKALDVQQYVNMPSHFRSLPPVLRRSFFNRKIYHEFLGITEQLNRKADMWALIITGGTGIGKSTFALPLIMKLAYQGMKVIYRYQSAAYRSSMQLYVDFSSPDDIKVDWALPTPQGLERFASYSIDPDVFVLEDGKAPAGQFEGNARTVVFAPPDPTGWYEFSKGTYRSRNEKVVVPVAWMPWWGYDELRHAAFRMGPISTLEDEDGWVLDRFKALGGSARWVVGDPRTTSQILDYLETQLRIGGVGPLINSGGTFDALHHLYLHAVVTADHKFAYWELASTQIADMVQRMSGVASPYAPDDHQAEQAVLTDEVI